MLVKKITMNVIAGCEAITKADVDRKIVRQFDTHIRKIENVSDRTKALYDMFIKEGGHYSRNPIKKFVSYLMSWNANRKHFLNN